MNDRQLALIKEFVALCEAADIECWLRGGWAMDFFLQRRFIEGMTAGGLKL
jgi:phosphorylcholine metabolism protein LicD